MSMRYLLLICMVMPSLHGMKRSISKQIKTSEETLAVKGIISDQKRVVLGLEVGPKKAFCKGFKELIVSGDFEENVDIGQVITRCGKVYPKDPACIFIEKYGKNKDPLLIYCFKNKRNLFLQLLKCKNTPLDSVDGQQRTIMHSIVDSSASSARDVHNMFVAVRNSSQPSAVIKKLFLDSYGDNQELIVYVLNNGNQKHCDEVNSFAINDGQASEQRVRDAVEKNAEAIAQHLAEQVPYLSLQALVERMDLHKQYRVDYPDQSIVNIFTAALEIDKPESSDSDFEYLKAKEILKRFPFLCTHVGIVDKNNIFHHLALAGVTVGFFEYVIAQINDVKKTKELLVQPTRRTNERNACCPLNYADGALYNAILEKLIIDLTKYDSIMLPKFGTVGDQTVTVNNLVINSSDEMSDTESLEADDVLLGDNV
jgi:hypothetical protein